MVKERISLTLDSDVLDRLDREVERRDIGNRSRAVEEFLRDYLGGGVETALVLGGGRESSCLIRINGKPVVEHVIEMLQDSGVEEVLVATADPEVREELEERDVEVVFEEEPRGTGGSLREIQGRVEDTFLVVNGDVMCDVDIDDMQDAHRNAEGEATVALTTAEDASSYGVINMKGNRIVGFREKPEESSSHLINAGVYLLEPRFLERLPDEREQPRVDIERVFEKVAEEGKLAGYVYEGEWKEVG
ncbi:MAG: sugar phosphate nucleotidyltransferase [Candidatus Nanohaloarchaea archaeon]|nr:sugar phosphate nucleotidyltransferase [Candidatus Nanohaloarchaea archaeon]